MKREQITRGRLRARISIEAAAEGGVCIFCPAEVSGLLYQHLAGRQIISKLPVGAAFSRNYRLDRLMAVLSLDQAHVEVTAFVSSLPEVCYEQDVN